MVKNGLLSAAILISLLSNIAGAGGVGTKDRAVPSTRFYSSSILSSDDTSAPLINTVFIYNSREDTYSSIASNSSAVVTASITDTNQSAITTAMITANLVDLGWANAVNPDTYDTATGIATWTLADTTPTEGIGVVVTVSAQDASSNIAAVATGTIIPDNTAPYISTINVYNFTDLTYDYVADGETVVVTATIVDSNSNLMDQNDVTGDFASLGFATVSADSYVSGTGIATWTLNGVSCSADGTLTVTVAARDDAGNVGTENTGTIVGDNAAPVISGITYYNQTQDNTLMTNGDTFQVTCTITDAELIFMTAASVTADLTDFGFAAGTPADSLDTVTGIASWTMTGITITNHGFVSVNIHARDIVGNQGSTQGDVVTPDYYSPGMVFLIDWHNPVTTMSVSNAGFTDRSSSGYNMSNVRADAIFQASPTGYVVSFDGVSQTVTGNQIDSTSPLAVTNQFTVVTMVVNNFSSVSTGNIISRIGGPNSQSEWQWITHWTAPPGNGAFGVVQTQTNPPGSSYDFMTQGNSLTITNSVSLSDRGTFVAMLYDYKALTVNIAADYVVDTPFADGNITTVNMTDQQVSTNTAIRFSGIPMAIGAEDAIFTPGARLFKGRMGPIGIWSGVLGEEELDRIKRWMERATGWIND